MSDLLSSFWGKGEKKNADNSRPDQSSQYSSSSQRSRFSLSIS
jgi:hypothetical protein